MTGKAHIAYATAALPGAARTAAPAPPTTPWPPTPPRPSRPNRRPGRPQDRIPRPHLRRPRFDTPTRLRLFLAGAAGSALALVALFGLGVASASDGLDVVGDGAGPRVVAANQLYGGLAGMDAELANIVLVGDETGLGFDRRAATDAYTADRDAVAQALQQAAEDAVDDAGRMALVHLVDDLAAYENLAGQIMLADAQADARALDARSPALPQLRQATDLMHTRLLPEADRLLAVDAGQVEHTFDDQYSTSRQAAFAALFVGLAAIAVLIGAQVFVFLRTHRIVNPGLAAATVLAIVLVAQGVGTLFSAAEDLRTSKRDAFDSVLALSRTKAVAADANGDESRFLVDPERSAAYEKAFFAKSQQLATFSGATSFAEYDKRLDSAVASLAAYRTWRTPDFGGDLLGREFRNLTFAGEPEAAEDVFRRFATYEQFDRRMRDYAAHDLRRAIDFNTSYHEGNSNWSYRNFQQALDDVLAINRDHMTRSARDGKDTLGGWSYLPAAGAALIVAAAYLGLRPRLREYRAIT